MPDGDTLTCSYRHPDGTTATVRVRIFAIDCPELAQNYGPEAKQVGQALLLHKTVTLHTTDIDRYGRLVADVVTHTGININAITYHPKRVTSNYKNLIDFNNFFGTTPHFPILTAYRLRCKMSFPICFVSTRRNM